MLLSEIDYVSWFVHVFTKVVDVEVFALVDNKEFTHPAHKPTIIRIKSRATTFGIEVKQTPLKLYHWVLASLVPNRYRG